MSTTEPLITTICAPATPHGVGALALIRMSGPQALEVAGRVFRSAACPDLTQSEGYRTYFGHVRDSSGELLDEVLLSVFRAPIPTRAKTAWKSRATVHCTSRTPCCAPWWKTAQYWPVQGIFPTCFHERQDGSCSGRGCGRPDRLGKPHLPQTGHGPDAGRFLPGTVSAAITFAGARFAHGAGTGLFR